MGSCRTHLMNCASPSPSAVCLREWLFSDESTLPKYLLVLLLWLLPVKGKERKLTQYYLTRAERHPSNQWFQRSALLESLGPMLNILTSLCNLIILSKPTGAELCKMVDLQEHHIFNTTIVSVIIKTLTSSTSGRAAAIGARSRGAWARAWGAWAWRARAWGSRASAWARILL